MTDTEAPSPAEQKAVALLRLISRFEHLTTFLAFAVMVAAIFADVLYRELSGVGLQWARQVGVYANIVVVMFGIGLASERGSHLRPRFADQWLPERLRKRVDFAPDALMALFCCLLMVISAQLAIESFNLGERSTLIGIQVWPIMSCIPAAFAIATLRHLLYAIFPALRPPDSTVNTAVPPVAVKSRVQC